jgi:hypothetical protein
MQFLKVECSKLFNIHFVQETAANCFYDVQVAAHPRNNLALGGSYLTVERFDGDAGHWTVVATDANWETR